MQKFSVCMSVYKNDSSDNFIKAVHSIFYQTVQPSEIVLVVDGPIPESIDKAITLLLSEIKCLKVVRLDNNMGHAFARQTGLMNVKNELVAVMDSDDISLPDRFEKQLKIFASNSDISVVGGIINEFVDNTNNIVGKRICPENDFDIKDYMKSRCPMNLVTVMLKKSDVMDVGGYIDWYCEEDYYLWIRLAIGGYKFYNIQENLVNVRVGNEMYQRRGGLKYFKSEARLQKFMFSNHIISLSRLCYNVFGRFIMQVLMPNKLRGFLFQKLFRK